MPVIKRWTVLLEIPDEHDVGENDEDWTERIANQIVKVVSDDPSVKRCRLVGDWPDGIDFASWMPESIWTTEGPKSFEESNIGRVLLGIVHGESVNEDEVTP